MATPPAGYPSGDPHDRAQPRPYLHACIPNSRPLLAKLLVRKVLPLCLTDLVSCACILLVRACQSDVVSSHQRPCCVRSAYCLPSSFPSAYLPSSPPPPKSQTGVIGTAVSLPMLGLKASNVSVFAGDGKPYAAYPVQGVPVEGKPGEYPQQQGYGQYPPPPPPPRPPSRKCPAVP